MIEFLIIATILSAADPAAQANTPKPPEKQSAPEAGFSPQVLEGYRLFFGLGAGGGWGNENTPYSWYGWSNAAVSLDVQAGIGHPSWGEFLVRYEYLWLPSAVGTVHPMCGPLTYFSNRNGIDFIYRYNFRGYKTVSPYIQAGPVLGWANYTFTDNSCSGTGMEGTNAFSVGLKAGAGVSINATSWLRFGFGFDYTVLWTGYPGSSNISTNWQTSQYPIFGLMIDFLFSPAKSDSSMIPSEKPEPARNDVLKDVFRDTNGPME